MTAYVNNPVALYKYMFSLGALFHTRQLFVIYLKKTPSRDFKNPLFSVDKRTYTIEIH